MKIIKGNFSGGNNKPAETGKKLAIVKAAEDSNDMEENYAALLLHLIEPFMHENPLPQQPEYMVNLGIIAWNMANTKSMSLPGFDHIFKAALDEVELEGKGEEIVKKMIAAKLDTYPHHNDFIEDYEITEENDTLYVSVTVKSFQHFFNDDEFDDDEREQLQ
jgi:hypothetical protein